jgi:hypothetical protein
MLSLKAEIQHHDGQATEAYARRRSGRLISSLWTQLPGVL